MIALLIAVIALIAGFAVTRGINAYRSENYDNPRKIAYPKFIGIGVAAILIIVSCIAVVPTGYTGILTTFGRVEDRAVSSGANFVLPWQKIEKMDNRVQADEFQMTAFTADIQEATIVLTVNHSVDPAQASTLYKTVGMGYFDTIVKPRVSEITKTVTGKYEAETLIGDRDTLAPSIKDTLAQEMQNYGIINIQISIVDIDFKDSFTDAVEAKQVAAQNKLTAETQQAQATMEEQARAERAIIAANAEAEQAKIAAQADLEVVQIQAEASLYAGQREAEMNQRISEALTPELIQYYWIKQWDGKLPTTALGSDSSFMIDLTD